MDADKHRSGLIMTTFRIVRSNHTGQNLFRKLSVSICVHLWLISLCFFMFPSRSEAQIRPVYDQGALGLGRLLKRLNTSASVMMIGAHPDDEDTALLSYLARGENARTAYLSLTHGDGGQNIIGPELGEALGVIRTEELLQARKLDGAEQYFTRAYDYGFSKTLAEAKAKWDEKIILCDVVRVIRNFRPLVVVSQFSGTPADGHGQHQYAGYISPLAVKAAADATQCKDAGDVWQVKKFYVRHRGTGEPTLRINTGKYDPLLGRSYFEIAMEARSQHKSQEQGVLELRGDQFSGLNLVGSDGKETGIFDGLDTSITGVAANTGNSGGPDAKTLAELKDISAAALREYDVREPEKILLQLIKGYVLADGAGRTTNASGIKMFFTEKRREFAAATKLAAGIQIDALADRETVVAGDSFSVSVKTFFALKNIISVKEPKIAAPAKWTVNAAEAPKEATQGFFRRETGDHAAFFSVGVPVDELPTTPYWLAEPCDGDLFRWKDGDDQRGLPLHSTIPAAEVTLNILGTDIVFRQPVEYRYADDTRGEIRRNVDVVPKLTVNISESLLIVPYSLKPQKRTLSQTITNQSSMPVKGVAVLDFQPQLNWALESSGRNFEFDGKVKALNTHFDLTIPGRTKPGRYAITSEIKAVFGLQKSVSMNTIRYPHIQTNRVYHAAHRNVQIIDLKTVPVYVGYIMGSGDQIPEAIRQIGLGVELLDEKYLSSGDLSRFDVIVAGIRVSEVRPDFAANNQRLLDWVNDGGTMIVQYQRPVYAQQNLMPFPAQMGPRVSDENAKVTILHPTHPIFNVPNKITDADFEGWVQERNLYNFSTMDEKYTGLLESHDAGETENKGGLVVADIGKGKYVYCSYSLFRQLPAGVPGAYRLLANMLSFRGVKGRKT
jgi:LmbE family N-acetylglucosaminyl deacetylase